MTTVHMSIQPIVEKLNIQEEYFLPYGRNKGKISLEVLKQPSQSEKHLVLVTATSPTPAGEGKTTTSIGLGQAFSELGKSVCVALREPSLGPCMGVKGGATGGGKAQITPSAEINLHFTGDFHAITSAHNLLAAAIDNHLHYGNLLQLNPKRITWKRVIDMNDRSLREIIIGMGESNGTIREAGFDITAASEIMAILCLSHDYEDLQRRLERIVIGYTLQHSPVQAKELGVIGAMMALLKDALLPNLVQTIDGTPVIVHGGPFANIAHGCNSILATKMAQHLADWTITEAGFGCDLGAEKFLDIKCREAELSPNAVVIVTTARALKMHGGLNKNELTSENLDALRKGLGNLTKHIETIQSFGLPMVVAINRFTEDTKAELQLIQSHCKTLGVQSTLAEHFARGGQGALELAQIVMDIATNKPYTPIYALTDSIQDKIRLLTQKVYGGSGIKLSQDAERDILRIQRQGYATLPICVAKTQNSLSDNPKRLGRPKDFHLAVQRVLLNAGAGFLVVITGNMMRMPGLPPRPAAEDIQLENGEIVGIS